MRIPLTMGFDKGFILGGVEVTDLAKLTMLLMTDNAKLCPSFRKEEDESLTLIELSFVIQPASSAIAMIKECKYCHRQIRQNSNGYWYDEDEMLPEVCLENPARTDRRHFPV